MTAPNDAKIVSALKENAESGFRLLMAKYKEAVYWHIRRLVVSYDDAQDATQETFIRVFHSFRQFKGECSLAAWIYRIATNEALRISEHSRSIPPAPRHRSRGCSRRYSITACTPPPLLPQRANRHFHQSGTGICGANSRRPSLHACRLPRRHIYERIKNRGI